MITRTDYHTTEEGRDSLGRRESQLITVPIKAGREEDYANDYLNYVEKDYVFPERRDYKLTQLRATAIKDYVRTTHLRHWNQCSVCRDRQAPGTHHEHTCE